MSKVLKYVGKGQWMNVDESEIASTDKILEIKKTKSTPNEKLIKFFEEIHSDIYKNGYRTMKLSSFLESFNITKRTEKSLEKIAAGLKENGLYTLPEISKELKLTSSMRIYNYPVRQIGELFDSEKALESYVADNLLFKSLHIDSVIRQHSPRGTKDKLDFKGESNDKSIVVLELKHKGGGKSAVEQVLRYAAILQMEYPDNTIRQILVTGIQNYETALAIRGMLPQQRELFEWYLYKFHKEYNHFEFVRVSDEEINFQSKAFHN